METRHVVCFALLLALAVAAAPAGRAQTLGQVHYLEITNPAYDDGSVAYRPPIATYEWQTVPGSPDPAEVRFIMLNARTFDDNFAATLDYIRDHPDAPEWSPWAPYAPPDVGTGWTSPPMDHGPYVLAVQGRDARGVAEDAFDEARNARRILIPFDVCHPQLEVTGDLIDPIVTTSIYTPVTEIDVAAGTALRFCLEASHKCDQPMEYRIGWDITDPIGWDITDPDDDDAWGMPFTPFPTPVVCSPAQTFAAGSHMFYAEVIDNSGFKSRVPILVHIGPATPVEPTTWGRIKALYSD